MKAPACAHRKGRLVAGKVSCASCGLSFDKIGKARARTLRKRPPTVKADLSKGLRIVVGVARVDGLHLVTESNAKGALWANVKRAEDQRNRTTIALLASSTSRLAPPVLVQITRVAPRRIRDDDNWIGAAKHVRDAIATWIGVDDADRHIVRYEVLQQTGPDAVLIEMKEDPCPISP